MADKSASRRSGTKLESLRFDLVPEVLTANYPPPPKASYGGQAADYTDEPDLWKRFESSLDGADVAVAKFIFAMRQAQNIDVYALMFATGCALLATAFHSLFGNYSSNKLQ